MKKVVIIIGLVLSFSSFAGSHYQTIGDSCWKCDGGSFKAGQIECTPERTARLYEVDLSKCSGSNANVTRTQRAYSPKQDQINSIQNQINKLQRQLSNLKKNNY